MKFKNNLKALREKARMTQQEIADALVAAGLQGTKQKIWKIENGTQRISAEEALAISKYIGCTEAELLGKDALQSRLSVALANTPEPPAQPKHPTDEALDAEKDILRICRSLSVEGKKELDTPRLISKIIEIVGLDENEQPKLLEDLKKRKVR